MAAGPSVAGAAPAPAAMILAAGRGERLRPLTDQRPKPLLEVGGKPLIVWQIEALARAGVHEVVINHAWLGEQLPAALGDGSRLGVRIRWSAEASALGTAGGVVQALALLGTPVFAVLSADICTDYDYRALGPAAHQLAQASHDLAHLVLVDDQRVRQDFDLVAGRVRASESPALTYGNIGVFHRRLFEGLPVGAPADLGTLLRAAVLRDAVSGSQYHGAWDNVGTQQDLARVNDRLLRRSKPGPQPDRHP